MYCGIVLNQSTRFKTKAQVIKAYVREEIYYICLCVLMHVWTGYRLRYFDFITVWNAKVQRKRKCGMYGIIQSGENETVDGM